MPWLHVNSFLGWVISLWALNNLTGNEKEKNIVLSGGQHHLGCCLWYLICIPRQREDSLGFFSVTKKFTRRSQQSETALKPTVWHYPDLGKEAPLGETVPCRSLGFYGLMLTSLLWATLCPEKCSAYHDSWVSSLPFTNIWAGARGVGIRNMMKRKEWLECTHVCMCMWDVIGPVEADW